MRYRCPEGHCFSINRRRNPPPFWTAHLDGASLRTIAAGRGISLGAAAAQFAQECSLLPLNKNISAQYCTRWGGVLNVDGVYIHVKGLPRAIPFIYGIDFETHDPVFGMLAMAEDEGAFVTFLETLKETSYPLRAVVADDVVPLRSALSLVFPHVPVQLCHVHLLRNIKEFLHLTERTPFHRPFFDALRGFMRISGEKSRRVQFRAIADQYGNDPRAWRVLAHIEARWQLLFQHEVIRREGLRCPRSNNLIEAYNSHLQGRLASIKGFERVSSAARWLEAWLLRRRFTPFRACGPPFTHLNGHTSFSRSRNPDLPWPTIRGLPPPEFSSKPTRN